MSITVIQPNGLHISTQATLAQMAADERLIDFADGVITRALAESVLVDLAAHRLAEILNEDDARFYGLLVAFLALDAEVSARLDGEPRAFPLTGFLTYRTKLPLGSFSLTTLRLPPLNPGGHYLWALTGAGDSLAVRLDLHPELGVAGHVRLAAGGAVRPPQRLPVAEHRLDRQVLTPSIISQALAAPDPALSPPLVPAERTQLATLLNSLHSNF